MVESESVHTTLHSNMDLAHCGLGPSQSLLHLEQSSHVTMSVTYSDYFYAIYTQTIIGTASLLYLDPFIRR